MTKLWYGTTADGGVPGIDWQRLAGGVLPDSLAEAVDRVGSEKVNLFLVKLALLNANALADPAVFRQHIEAASCDLLRQKEF